MGEVAADGGLDVAGDPLLKDFLGQAGAENEERLIKQRLAQDQPHGHSLVLVIARSGTDCTSVIMVLSLEMTAISFP